MYFVAHIPHSSKRFYDAENWFEGNAPVVNCRVLICVLFLPTAIIINAVSFYCKIVYASFRSISASYVHTCASTSCLSFMCMLPPVALSGWCKFVLCVFCAIFSTYVLISCNSCVFRAYFVRVSPHPTAADTDPQLHPASFPARSSDDDGDCRRRL